MSYLTTNDLRIMAIMLDIHPDHLGVSDKELLFVVQHQLMHAHMVGKFKAFYDTLPSDIARRFLLDRRTRQWFLDNLSFFKSELKKPTLAERLDKAVESDIWSIWGDTVQQSTVRAIKSDMLEAAALLRKHGLDG